MGRDTMDVRKRESTHEATTFAFPPTSSSRKKRFEGTKTKDENQRNLSALKSGHFFFGNALLSRESHSRRIPTGQGEAGRGTDRPTPVRTTMAPGTITQAGVFKRKRGLFSSPSHECNVNTPREAFSPPYKRDGRGKWMDGGGRHFFSWHSLHARLAAVGMSSSPRVHRHLHASELLHRWWLV